MGGNIVICNHVDDPLIFCENEEDEKWIHQQLEKRFETKGRQLLKPGNPIDYLSMTLRLHENGDLSIDNRDKIEKYLDEVNMLGCNPKYVPISKTTLERVAANKSAGLMLDASETSICRQHIGKMRWIADTTHPTLCTALSIISQYAANPPEGFMDLIMDMYKWLQHAKDFALIKRADDRSGMRIDSDSDWAGLHSITGDTRSRSGSIYINNGMPFGWASTFQACKSSGYDPVKHGSNDMADPATAEDDGIIMWLIAMSSGEAELIALRDTLKGAMSHYHYVKELGKALQAITVNVDKDNIIDINTDSAAAQGFVKGHGKTGRMRHIDVSADWVQQLRDRSICKIIKIPGTENIADGLTKILPAAPFEEWAAKVMQRIFEPSIGK